MRIGHVLVVLLVGLIVAFMPLDAAAQDNANDDDLLLRVNGDVDLPAGESVNSLIVGNGDATIAGTVDDFLLVIKGTGSVTGRVDGDIVVINGTLRLEPTANVQGDITLVRSDLVRDPAAVVNGDINERSSYSWGWGSAIFSLLFWFGTTIVVLVAGLLFAAFGARQLVGAGRLATERIGESVVATLIVWIGLPILAVVAFITLVGIPLSLAILIVLLPALGFLGYIVSGTRLGSMILRRDYADGSKPYLAAVLGLLILQLIGLIPFIGALIIVIATLYGAGALVYYAFLGWRRRGVDAPAAPPQPVVAPT
jgi:hypothetical protein